MGSPTIFKGTAGASSLTVVPMTNRITGKASFASSATVRNLDSTNVLRVYIPASGAGLVEDYITIPTNSAQLIPGPFNRLSVVAGASTVAFEILASVA